MGRNRRQQKKSDPRSEAIFGGDRFDWETIQRIAFTHIPGLKPKDFWSLTLPQLNLLLEAAEERRRWECGEWARRVAAFAYASRAKKPQMDELLRICGYNDRSEPVNLREEYAEMIAESEARVAAEAAKKERDGGRSRQ